MPKTPRPVAAPKPAPVVEEDDPSLLGRLAKEVGAAHAGDLVAWLAKTDDSALVAEGRKITSDKLLKDLRRLYAQAWAFWQIATPEQKLALRGFSPRLLALALSQGVVLEKMWDVYSLATRSEAGQKAKTDELARAEAGAARPLREQAYSVLADAAGTGTSERRDLDAELPVGLDAGKALGAMAGVLAGWLAEGSAELQGRLALGGLDASYVKELQAAAKGAKKTRAAAGGLPTTAKVTIGTINRHDGVNILLLDQIVTAFDKGHDRNASIPRLIPITTRHVLNRTPRPAASKKEEKAPAGVTSETTKGK